MSKVRAIYLGGIAAFMTLTALPACSKKPSSDVVATVNGETISKADLATEAKNTGLSLDDAKAQQNLLTQVINRKLLAQEAVAQKLDAKAWSKSAEAKARDTALAEVLMLHLTKDSGEPDEAAIQRHIKANPAKFGAREILELDQLQVSAAAVNNDWLRPANSLTEVAEILKARNVPFQRGRATADTAAMPPQLLKVLTERPNDPFAVPQGDNLIISQVVERKRSALSTAQLRAMAADEIQRQAYQQISDAKLQALHQKAKITRVDNLSEALDSRR